MKVNKPPMVFFGHLHLQYKGSNYLFEGKRSFYKINIIDIDYDLKEELVVSLKMYDGTEIKFSMISTHLYMKINGEYELQKGIEEQEEQEEEQNFGHFELLFTDEFMLFDGGISYHKKFENTFSFREYFNTTITIRNNPRLLEIWKKQEQIIIE